MMMIIKEKMYQKELKRQEVLYSGLLQLPEGKGTQLHWNKKQRGFKHEGDLVESTGECRGRGG